MLKPLPLMTFCSQYFAYGMKTFTFMTYIHVEFSLLFAMTMGQYF